MRREEDPVGGPELRWVGLSLEHPELVAQDEDLEVLGPVVVVAPDAETSERAQDEVQQKQHRRMVEAV